MSKINIKLPRRKDIIGVDTLSNGYPLVFKSYHKKSDFIKMVRQIENTAEIIELFNKTPNPKL